MRRKIPEVLTTTKQEAIVAQPNPRYLTGHRNRVMLRLMLDTGLRLSEAIHLCWKDINLNSGKVMVHQGKGAKDRTLWTGEGNLAPAIRTCQSLFPKLTFLFAFPYRRVNDELRQLAPGSFKIKVATYLAHQFPDPLVLPDGTSIAKPTSW